MRWGGSSTVVAAMTMLLAGSEWGLMGGGEAPSLQFGDGIISGSGGCNRYSGPYTQDGTTLRIGQLIVTQMDCADDVMAQENDWFRMLERVRRVDATHAVLELKDEAGTSLVKLARRDWD
jgi:heat shock protein HslJ